MFERAARLTPENEPRARRLYLAAHSAWLAGQGDRALQLLDDATAAGADDLIRADITYLQGRIDLRRNATGDVVGRLVAEAGRVEPLDASRAGAMLATAAAAAPADARSSWRGEPPTTLTAGRDDAADLLASLVLARALLKAGEASRGSRAPRPRARDARREP